MEKFVLHQTRQLAELRNEATEKIDPMHQAQSATDFAFSRQDCHEHFAGRFGVLKCAGDLSQSAAQQIFELRAKIDIVFLSELKRLHHFQWIGLKNVALVRVEMTFLRPIHWK